jgi:hypothetical protein
VKRVRHLIQIGRLQVKRRGQIFEGRKSWCDAAYAEPDPPGTKHREKATEGQMAALAIARTKRRRGPRVAA